MKERQGNYVSSFHFAPITAPFMSWPQLLRWFLPVDGTHFNPTETMLVERKWERCDMASQRPGGRRQGRTIITPKGSSEKRSTDCLTSWKTVLTERGSQTTILGCCTTEHTDNNIWGKESTTDAKHIHTMHMHHAPRTTQHNEGRQASRQARRQTAAKSLLSSTRQTGGVTHKGHKR